MKILSNMRQNCVRKIFYIRLVLWFLKEFRFLVGTIWESISYCPLFWSHFGAVFRHSSSMVKVEKKFFFWSKSGRPYDSCPKAKNLHGLIAWNTFCGPIFKREITVFTQFFLVSQLFFLCWLRWPFFGLKFEKTRWWWWSI